MFNLLGLYNLLTFYLKSSFWDEINYWSNEDVFNENALTRLPELKNNTSPCSNEYVFGESWSIREWLEKLWLGDLYNKHEDIRKSFDEFFLYNNINLQKWDNFKLDISNIDDIPSYNLTITRNSEVLSTFNLTEAIKNKKIDTAKFIMSECRAWLDDLNNEIKNAWSKSENFWENKKASIDFSKLPKKVLSHIVNPKHVHESFDFLSQSCWFTKEQSCWILASQCKESSFDPNPSWNKTHFWAFQWSHERANQIKNGTWINVKTADNLDQLKALYWEITQNSKHCPWTFEALKSSRTAEEAAIAFLTKFEKPGGIKREAKIRADYARSFFTALV